MRYYYQHSVKMIAIQQQTKETRWKSLTQKLIENFIGGFCFATGKKRIQFHFHFHERVRQKKAIKCWVRHDNICLMLEIEMEFKMLQFVSKPTRNESSEHINEYDAE